MKVLLLTDDLMPGGVTKHVLDIAHEFSEQGLKMTIATSKGGWESRVPHGVALFNIKLLQQNSYRKTMLGYPSACWQLLQHCRNNSYDLIHAHKRYADAVASVVSKWTHVPHLSTSHNIFTNHKKTTFFGPTVIAVSQEVKQNLLHVFHLAEERVTVIPVGCNPLRRPSKEMIYQFRRQWNIPDYALLVTSVGRMDPDKDRKTLLAAIKLLVDEGLFQNWILLLVGEGNEMTTLQQLSSSLKLQQYTRFIPNSEFVPTAFSLAEFCVLSSFREGFPYVNLEAASLGKAHVATAVGGVPEFILHEKTGLLVAPRQPQELALQMKRMILNPNLCHSLGTNAQASYFERYTLDRMVTDIKKVYERVVHSFKKNRIT